MRYSRTLAVSGYPGRYLLGLSVIWRILFTPVAVRRTLGIIQRHGLVRLISRLRYPLSCGTSTHNVMGQGPFAYGYVPLRLPEAKRLYHIPSNNGEGLGWRGDGYLALELQGVLAYRKRNG